MQNGFVESFNGRMRDELLNETLFLDLDHSVLPIVESLRANGVTHLRGLAFALNSRGIRTARGGQWHVSNVKNVMDRVTRRDAL